MTCGINCKQRTYTTDNICSTLLDVIGAVLEDRGHGDMTVQIFPDGSGEVSLDDGLVVGVFDNGSWR